MVNKGTILSATLGLVARPVCFICYASCETDGFCASCSHDLRQSQSFCIHCGATLTYKGLCSECMNHPPSYDAVIAAYPYKPPISNLIRSMKYQHRLELLSAMGASLLEQIQQCHENLPDCLLPVPLHRTRLISRGFNQSLELARFIGKSTGLNIDHRLIRRSRMTAPQFSLSHKERRNNVRNAFRLLRKPKYNCVAIVDDVITSGATAEEIACLLKASGVSRVLVWALAHAGERK